MYNASLLLFSFSLDFTDLVNRDISEASIGHRSVVATSPDRLEECRWELEADTEKFIKAIEVCYSPKAEAPLY